MNELRIVSQSAPMNARRVPTQKRRRRVLPRRIETLQGICGSAPSSTAFSGSDSKSLHELSSVELLQRCLAGRDESAWFEFVRRFQPLIAAVVMKTLRRCVHARPGLVDDLIQETYLKLCANDFKALRNFNCRHEHALEGFLKVVASNVTQDYLRSFLSTKRGCGKGEDDLEQVVLWKEAAVQSAEQIEREITLQQVQQCLEREVSEPHRSRDCRIFWLYYRHGLTAKAISRRADIGLTVKGAESALFRLTHLVRTKLGRPQRNGLWEHSLAKVTV